MHAEVSTGIEITGYGLNTDLRVAIAESAASNCLSILTGGASVAPAGAAQAAAVGDGNVNQNTMGTDGSAATEVTTTFTIDKAFVNAVICLMVPTAQGGTGNLADTSIVVSVIGSGRDITVDTDGSNYFAGRIGIIANSGVIAKQFGPPRVKLLTGASAEPKSADSSGLVTVTATIKTNGGTNTNNCGTDGGYGTAGALNPTGTKKTTCGRLDTGILPTQTINAGATSFVLASSADGSTDDIYKGYQLTIVTGGVSGTKLITGYTSGSKTVTVNAAFTVLPATGSTYTVQQMDSVTFDTVATANTASSFSLATSASTDDDYYNGMMLTVGADTRLVTDYVGSTRVVTLRAALSSAPSNTDIYYITQPNDVTNLGYAPDAEKSAGSTDKMRVCSFPEMVIDAYGENYVLTYTAVMVNDEVGVVSAVTNGGSFTLATATALAIADYYKGRYITIGSETKQITGYSAGRVVTCAAFTTAPTAGATAYHIHYRSAQETTDSGQIDVSGNAMKTVAATEGYGWVAGTTAGPTTAPVLQMQDNSGAQITDDKLSGCCQTVASIAVNHKRSFNGHSAGTVGYNTWAFASGVATMKDGTNCPPAGTTGTPCGVYINNWGQGYRLRYTPTCSAITTTQQTAVQGAAISVLSDNDATGTLTAVTSGTSFTLASNAEPTLNYYNNRYITISGVTKQITAYSATRVVTVGAAFSPTPTTASTYVISQGQHPYSTPTFDVAGTATRIQVYLYKTGWVNDRANSNANLYVKVTNNAGTVQADDVSGVDRLAVKVTTRPTANDGFITVSSYAYTSGTPLGDNTNFKDASVNKLTDGKLAGSELRAGDLNDRACPSFICMTQMGYFSDDHVVGWPKATSSTITFTLPSVQYLNTVTIGYIYAPGTCSDGQTATPGTNCEGNGYQPYLGSSYIVYPPSQIVITTSEDGTTWNTGTTLSNGAGNPLATPTCEYCIRHEVTWTASTTNVRYVRLAITGPTDASADYYMLDEVFFTSGYSGGAGTWGDATKAVALPSAGTATFTNLNFDRYSLQGKWKVFASVPVPQQAVQYQTCYDGAACGTAAGASGAGSNAQAWAETDAFNVDQLVYKRTITVEAVA
jgi:hypothetical protein